MSSESTPLVALQDPVDVSLDDIEHSLSQIWVSHGGDGNAPAAVRATTFTLVVYEADDTQQLLAALGYYSGPIDGILGPRMQAALRSAQKDYGLPITGRPSPELRQILQQEYAAQAAKGMTRPDRYAMDVRGGSVADAIASQNPCRVIALCPTLGDDTGITAQVAAYCPINKKVRSSLICCEYITLKGTHTAFARVEPLLQSLVIRDLPRFLWWKGDLQHNLDLFQTLAPKFSRIIVDSSEFLVPTSTFRTLADLLQQGLPITDLNWRRLGAWQELAAEAFDPPERRLAVKEIDQVVIDYEKGNPAQALMYLGWLASRLQWQPRRVTLESGDYDLYHIELVGSDERLIKAELAGIPTGDSGLVLGDLIDLKLTSSNPEADCCTIICSETRGCMRMESGGSAQMCRTYHVTPLTDQTAELLLSQELQRWGQDVLYTESFAAVLQLLDLIP
ncbi:glucose-6-phosphate dehydrogenase assembly protein OpcA [Synechococcus sp. PCC 6716]|nr:glucose-6-phosphate dehydrogenase assembly protein OpcA [Synechococcus sp. PCC 6716]